MKKWKVGKNSSIRWWNELSLMEKQKYKKKYEDEIWEKNTYPDLIYTKDTRISKLTDNQIRCIWRFKDQY